MALAFSQFGSSDRVLYEVYLATYFQNAGYDVSNGGSADHGGSWTSPGRESHVFGSGLERGFFGRADARVSELRERLRVCAGSGSDGGSVGRDGNVGEGVSELLGAGSRVAKATVHGESQVRDDAADVAGVSQSNLEPARGVHYLRNKARREKEKERKKVPEWRRGARSSSSAGSVPSLVATVATVTTEVAEELEARRTLAARRVVENKVATKMGELRLASLQDKDKTNALAKLELARIQERINTATAKSQASYKKCDSPLDSVGSAGSAGEFAWKQEIRKRDAIVVERDYLRVQLDEMLKTATPEMKRAVAAIPEPYIPTDEEIAAMDEDIAPYMSQAEMEAETERYFSRADIFFERD